MTKDTNRQPRPYRIITPETVARFKADKALHGNGTSAVRNRNPDYSTPENRAFRIQSKAKEQSAVDYVDTALQQIASEGVQQLARLLNSNDDRIVLSASRYAIDQVRGKAVQRTESKHLSLNIQTVID